MNSVQDVLNACSVSGHLVTLPAYKLDKKLYQDVAKHLDLIGGKWNRKEQGFIFNEDPAHLLKQIAKGEKRNIKKEFQFYGTPDSLANRLVELAEIEQYDNVLEPSAGQGAIIKAIHRKNPHLLVHYFELMPLNRTFLEKLPNTEFIKDNFLAVKMPGLFHKIIANPPFSKNQDINHILKMYDCLVMGGRIVTIASKHWQYASGGKEQAFKEWLNDLNAEIIDVPAGEFKESGTNISTCIIVIDKPYT